MPDLIRYHGYPAEEHHVSTEDGYILELHRVPYGRVNNSTNGRIPVFLMHGLFSSSFSYVLLGPEDSLTYYLAERGYDVWIGNARGGYYSRAHVSLNPDSDLDYWKYSWEQLGEKDMPAVVDYILQTTGQPKLHYVGHSQGGTTFLVFASTRPEYNEKIISFHGLAPASYFQNFEITQLKTVALFEHVLETMALNRGVLEITGMSDLPFVVSDVLCSNFGVLEQTCIDFILGLIDTEPGQEDELVSWMGHNPGGGSIRLLAHFGQSINSGRFARYDYRGLDNWFRYNAWASPAFNLSLITTPAYIHYTLNDNLVNYNDVFILAEELGNLVKLYQVARTSFDHGNFINAHDAKELVYDLMYEDMKEAENK